MAIRPEAELKCKQAGRGVHTHTQQVSEEKRREEKSPESSLVVAFHSSQESSNHAPRVGAEAGSDQFSYVIIFKSHPCDEGDVILRNPLSEAG